MSTEEQMVKNFANCVKDKSRKFGIINEVSVKITVFLYVSPCSLVELCRSCSSSCCLHHLGRCVPKIPALGPTLSEVILLHICKHYFSKTECFPPFDAQIYQMICRLQMHRSNFSYLYQFTMHATPSTHTFLI
jgi:hypothetical protein